VIEKPKTFHWKPMHNEQLKKFNDYISIFHLKRYSKQISYQQFHLELKFIQVCSHLRHLHFKNVNIVKNINTCLNNIETSTNTNDISQTHFLE
jgi:hypothetical protein